MLLRVLCVVGLGLVMLGAPAKATPWSESFRQRDDHESPGEGRGKQDASSLQLSSARPGVRSHGPSLVQLGELLPGLWRHSKKVDVFSGGPFRNGERPVVPPGLSKKGDLGWAPLGPPDPSSLSKRDELPMTLPGLSLADESGESVSAIPEPTGLLLFGSGLLLARAVGRHRRIPSTA